PQISVGPARSIPIVRQATRSTPKQGRTMSSIDKLHRPSNEKPARMRIFRSFTEVLPRLGRDCQGRLINVASLHRWRSRGFQLSDGPCLRLMAIREPGRWVTTDEWLDEFLAAITRDRNSQSIAVPARPTQARRRSAEQIEQELDRIGLK